MMITTLNRTPALAAAVTWSALPAAIALAHVISDMLQSCSLRASLPASYAAALVPALLTAAYVVYAQAQTASGRAGAGILAAVATLAVVLGGGLAIVLIGVAGGAAVYPLTVMFAVFAVVGLPLFWLAQRFLTGVPTPVALVIALLPLAAFVLGDASKACHLAV